MKKINHMMNNWVKKQVDFCIVGKKGVRDNLQIAVGLLNYRQETAKKRFWNVFAISFGMVMEFLRGILMMIPGIPISRSGSYGLSAS